MAKDIWPILRRRYPEKEYALLEEVRDKAGFDASRSADYVVVNLWPSRGLSISGIELKSFRSDWLSEMKKPQKAENIFQYCDYFWLLTTDETIAKLEEIPETWGWMCIQGERIKVMKDAPKLTPVTISKHFFAAAIKRASDKSNFVRISDIEDRIDEAKESGRNESKREITRLTEQVSEMSKAINDFRQTSGIDLHGYHRWNTNPKKIGEAVKFIENGGIDSIKEELTGLEETAKRPLNSITRDIATLSAVVEDKNKTPEQSLNS